MKLSVFYPSKPVQLDGHSAMHSVTVGRAGIQEITAGSGAVFVRREPLPHLIITADGWGKTDEVPSWANGPGRPAKASEGKGPKP